MRYRAEPSYAYPLAYRVVDTWAIPLLFSLIMCPVSVPL